MKICDFPGSRVIGKPVDWDEALDGPCGVIYVADHVDTLSGRNIMYTVYQFTTEELEALQAGGVLRLGIMGDRHPVFQLGVLNAEAARNAQLEPKWDLGDIL